MAYVVPSVADFKARFPEITATDAAIQFALDDAGKQVDQSWTEYDFHLGIMLYAAHLLTEGGASGVDGPSFGISAENFGPVGVSYKTDSIGTLSMTKYGSRFVLLRRQNRSGARVAVP